MKKSILAVVSGLFVLVLTIMITVFASNKAFESKMDEQRMIVEEYRNNNESLSAQVSELESLIASATVESVIESTTEESSEAIQETEAQDNSWMETYGDNKDSNLGWDETKPEMEYVSLDDISQYGWDPDNLNEIIHDFSKNVFNVDPAISEFVGIEINDDGNQEVIFTNSGLEYRVILTMDKMLVKAVRPQ